MTRNAPRGVPPARLARIQSNIRAAGREGPLGGAVHPAALILADHAGYAYAGRSATSPTHCACGWTGPSCDHPAHLADVLGEAGLLAPVRSGDPGVSDLQVSDT